jgi:hypothetical protein
MRYRIMESIQQGGVLIIEQFSFWDFGCQNAVGKSAFTTAGGLII